MKFSITHELPGRLRIKLAIPRGYSFDVNALKGIEGVKSVSFNSKTGNLLIRHNANGSAKKSLLKALENKPLASTLPLSRKVADFSGTSSHKGRGKRISSLMIGGGKGRVTAFSRRKKQLSDQG